MALELVSTVGILCMYTYTCNKNSPCTCTCTCLLVELNLEVGGKNNVKVARLVERGHLVSTQLEPVSVEVPADIHQLLFTLRVQFCVVASVPSQLKEIGVATQASNLVKNETSIRCYKCIEYV